MKLGCISWSHRNAFADGALDLEKWIKHCNEDAHLDGVEIWNNHLPSLDEAFLKKIKACAEENNLVIYSVATKCKFGDFSKKEVEHEQQVMRDWLNATSVLGASIMRISIAGNDLRNPEHQEIVFRALTDVIKEGSYPEITVGIENQEPGVVQNSADVKRMLDISGGLLKVVLDNGSFLDKQDSYEFLETNLPNAAVVHLKFFDLADDGSDKVLNYSRISDILHKSVYDGYLSIEYDSNEPAIRDVPKIAKYLRTII